MGDLGWDTEHLKERLLSRRTKEDGKGSFNGGRPKRNLSMIWLCRVAWMGRMRAWRSRR
jgi:hypothetical protein